MKVYVVTEGEYSNYHIEEVFSTREMAEKYVALHKRAYYDYYEIEEYEVDKVQIEGDVDIMSVYTATYVRNDVADVWVCYPSLDDNIPLEPIIATKEYADEMKRVQDEFFEEDFRNGRMRYTICFEKENSEKAKKIFQDRLAELNAKEQGIM